MAAYDYTAGAGTAKAGNGVGGAFHVLTNTTGANLDTVLLEAQLEGFTVIAVEGTGDADYIILQGTGTPAVGGTLLVVSFPG